LKTLAAVALLLMGVTGAAFARISAAVPEIDGASAVNALALVSGALLVIRSRRKA
jgi:hypothetical protein